jgi:hypothetical protein
LTATAGGTIATGENSPSAPCQDDNSRPETKKPRKPGLFGVKLFQIHLPKNGEISLGALAMGAYI